MVLERFMQETRKMRPKSIDHGSVLESNIYRAHEGMHDKNQT